MLPQIINGITFKIFSNKFFSVLLNFFSVKRIGFFVMHFGACTSKNILWFD